MKSILLCTLLFVVETFSSESNAQGYGALLSFRQENQPAVVSPMSMIDEMEKQLSAQFTSPVARHATVTILLKDQIVAHGTVLSGLDQNFSYLLCPSDVLRSGEIRVRFKNGSFFEPEAGTAAQLLSKQDNLSILRIPHVPGAIKLSSLEPSRKTGSFIGILGNQQSWKTGTVTNQIRSAILRCDPRMQRSLQNHWARIGLHVSERRSGFPEVIETDLDLLPSEAGSPVFDRDGAWQGVAIARVDRHSTLLIPALRVAELIRDFERESRS